jgi:histidine phosphotransferase ChpT
LLAGVPGEHSVDAHAIQPFYTGMLARSCSLGLSFAMEGEVAVLAAR